jgi:hypothetical protein
MNSLQQKSSFKALFLLVEAPKRERSHRRRQRGETTLHGVAEDPLRASAQPGSREHK